MIIDNWKHIDNTVLQKAKMMPTTETMIVDYNNDYNNINHNDSDNNDNGSDNSYNNDDYYHTDVMMFNMEMVTITISIRMV